MTLAARRANGSPVESAPSDAPGDHGSSACACSLYHLWAFSPESRDLDTRR